LIGLYFLNCPGAHSMHDDDTLLQDEEEEDDDDIWHVIKI
jgi:hypothetical protein